MKRRFPVGKVTAFLSLVVVLLGLISLPPNPPAAMARSPIADVRLDGFRYIVNQDDVGDFFVFVEWDWHSVAGLKAYAAESRRQGDFLLRQGVNQFYVLVAFNHPLSVEKFTRLVADVDMQVKSYRIRVIDGQGMRATIGGSPIGGELVPAWRLQDTLQRMAEVSGGQTKFVGFYEVEGVVSGECYKKLLAHPRVFLVDVLVTLARRILQQRGWKVRLDKIQWTGGSPYWDMEDLGLEHFGGGD